MSNQHGASDRAASSSTRRAALAKFDWVMWGVYRGSASLAATLEASIAAVNALNPDCIHSNYVIGYEAGSQGGEIDSIVRTGSAVVVTTTVARNTSVSVGAQVRIVSSRASAGAYNGLWTVTAVTANSFTFTATGAALTAADDTSARDAYYIAKNTSSHDLVQKLGDMNWWLRKQGTTGPRVAWTSSYGNWDMNLGNYAPLDAGGDDWVTWKAKDDSTQIFSKVAGLQYVYLDNYNDPRDDKANDVDFPGQRTKRDWKRSGVLQDQADADILAAHRAGQARYATKHRALSVGRAKSANIKVIGNVESTFLNAGYENTLEAAFLEGTTGASYSPATLADLLARHDAIRARLLAPAQVVWSARGASITDYKAMRYGLGAAQLRNVYFGFSAATYDNITWYDEYETPLGDPVDAEPSTPWFNGMHRRRFTNAWVIVNSTSSTQSVDLTGQNLRRLGAADFGRTPQDPVANSGLAVTTLSLASKDAAFLVYAS